MQTAQGPASIAAGLPGTLKRGISEMALSTRGSAHEIANQASAVAQGGNPEGAAILVSATLEVLQVGGSAVAARQINNVIDNDLSRINNTLFMIDSIKKQQEAVRKRLDGHGSGSARIEGINERASKAYLKALSEASEKNLRESGYEDIYRNLKNFDKLRSYERTSFSLRVSEKVKELEGRKQQGSLDASGEKALEMLRSIQEYEYLDGLKRVLEANYEHLVKQRAAFGDPAIFERAAINLEKAADRIRHSYARHKTAFKNTIIFTLGTAAVAFIGEVVLSRLLDDAFDKII
jgi:hypothetical protein